MTIAEQNNELLLLMAETLILILTNQLGSYGKLPEAENIPKRLLGKLNRIVAGIKNDS